MPIPGMDRKDILFNSRAYWKLRFLWRPRRSAITGRWLWLRYVYEGTAIWTGVNEAVVEFRYHEPVEHIIWKLKQ
jgi:hypothetical protein